MCKDEAFSSLDDNIYNTCRDLSGSGEFLYAIPSQVVAAGGIPIRNDFVNPDWSLVASLVLNMASVTPPGKFPASF